MEQPKGTEVVRDAVRKLKVRKALQVRVQNVGLALLSAVPRKSTSFAFGQI